MSGITNDPKPYGVGAGRLWLEGHLSKLDPKIGEPYASQVAAEIDAYIERRVMDEREACARIAEDADDTGIHQWGEDRNSRVAQKAGRDIAAAIRDRSKPLPNPLDPQ